MKNRVRSLAISTAIPFETFYFIVLLSVAMFASAVGVQLITGSLVNATLFLSLYLVGFHGAVLIALVPSAMALGGGLLPAELTPMVPFIIMSNLLLITVFSVFKNRLAIGVILASVLKFAFLFSSGYIVMGLVLDSGRAVEAVGMMGWPQLLTALTGGFIAITVLKAIKGNPPRIV